MTAAGTSDADGQFAEPVGVILPETQALFERQAERKKIISSRFRQICLSIYLSISI